MHVADTYSWQGRADASRKKTITIPSMGFSTKGPAFDGAGFKSKTHIQIAVRNPNVIVVTFASTPAHLPSQRREIGLSPPKPCVLRDESVWGLCLGTALFRPFQIPESFVSVDLRAKAQRLRTSQRRKSLKTDRGKPPRYSDPNCDF